MGAIANNQTQSYIGFNLHHVMPIIYSRNRVYFIIRSRSLYVGYALHNKKRKDSWSRHEQTLSMSSETNP